jgi:hypothetical protein
VLSVEKFSQASALAMPVGGVVRCVMASGEDPNHVDSKARIEELIKEGIEINKFRVDFIVKKVSGAFSCVAKEGGGSLEKLHFTYANVVFCASSLVAAAAAAAAAGGELLRATHGGAASSGWVLYRGG